MKFLSLFKVIFAKDNVDDVALSARTVGIWGALFFALVSVLLTALNISEEYWLMTGMTSGLVIGFLIASLCAYRNHINASRILIVVLCGLVFSYFAISGENEGFAILWILLVPLIGSYLVGLRFGFCLSAYFQIFLILLFYTPLSAYVHNFYTDTFMIRYPLLYFADFASVTILMCQRQRLFNETHRLANYDIMTGLLNRNCYNKVQDSLNEGGELCVVSFDLNGLKIVNDTRGHKAGDELICALADLLKQCFQGDMIFRIGGDEFIVLSETNDTEKEIENFRQKAESWKGNYSTELHISLGYASRKDMPEASFQDLSVMADKRMYDDKAKFYQQGNRDRRRG